MQDLSNENIIHIVRDNMQYIQFKKLLEYKDIISHAYSLGIDKNFRTAKANKENLTKEEYEKAIKDYKDLCECINVNYNDIVKTNQSHTDNIKCIYNKIKKYKPDINLKDYNNTDGMITNSKNIVLSTTNADCILLLFFDPQTKTIANVHSGWRGTLQRISVKTIDKMINKYNCKIENIICCICPSIRKCHFQVDKDVAKQFNEEFKELNLNNIIDKQKNREKWNIDTVMINKIILEQRGLKKENIIDSQICSVCNSNLVHSYRTEKEGYGLSTAIISLI